MYIIIIFTRGGKNGKKKIWLGILVMVLLFGMTVVSCGSLDGYSSGDLSGIYVSQSGRFTVEFLNSTNCKWYQDGYSFNGTYEKFGNDSYRLDMKGHSGYNDTIFTAVKEGKDLRITGGIVYGELFVKQ